MIITNLIIFYLISVAVIASIPAIIKVIKELKQWKKAYDKQERITKLINEFEDSMLNVESNEYIDEYLRKAILYD